MSEHICSGSREYPLICDICWSRESIEVCDCGHLFMVHNTGGCRGQHSCECPMTTEQLKAELERRRPRREAQGVQ